MSDFTIEQLEALKEGTTPGPWAAIADHPYISIVIANDIDQIHAPIVDIKDGTTDEPEVDKHHELMAAAPALVDALIAERRAHAKLLRKLDEMLSWWGKSSEKLSARGMEELAEVSRSRMAQVAQILEADNE